MILEQQEVSCAQLDCMSRSVSVSGFGLTYRASSLSLPHESGLGLGSALGSTTCTALLSDTSAGALHTLPMPLTTLPVSAGVALCREHAAQFQAVGEELLQPLTQHELLRQIDENVLMPECHSGSTQSSNGSGSAPNPNAQRELQTAEGPAMQGARTRFASGQQHRGHRGSGQRDDGSECSCEQSRELLPLAQMHTLRAKTPVPLPHPIGGMSASGSKALTKFAPSPTPMDHLPPGDYLPVARATTPAPRVAPVSVPSSESVAVSMGLWYPSQFSPNRTLPYHPSQQQLQLSSAALKLDYSPSRHAAVLPAPAALHEIDSTLVDPNEPPNLIRDLSLFTGPFPNGLTILREPWTSSGPVSERVACAQQQQADFTRSLLPLARLDPRAVGCGSAFGADSDSSVRLGLYGGVGGHPLSLSRSSTGNSLVTQQQMLHHAPARPATATANVLRRVPEEQSFV